MRTSKVIYMIVERIGNEYKLQNLETKDILSKLYNPRNLLKIDNIEEVNDIIDEPIETTEPIEAIEPVKYITPVRSRKDRKINKQSEPVKYIGATPVKSRKVRKNNLQ